MFHSAPFNIFSAPFRFPSLGWWDRTVFEVFINIFIKSFSINSTLSFLYFSAATSAWPMHETGVFPLTGSSWWEWWAGQQLHCYPSSLVRLREGKRKEWDPGLAWLVSNWMQQWQRPVCRVLDWATDTFSSNSARSGLLIPLRCCRPVLQAVSVQVQELTAATCTGKTCCKEILGFMRYGGTSSQNALTLWGLTRLCILSYLFLVCRPIEPVFPLFHGSCLGQCQGWGGGLLVHLTSQPHMSISILHNS